LKGPKRRQTSCFRFKCPRMALIDLSSDEKRYILSRRDQMNSAATVGGLSALLMTRNLGVPLWLAPSIISYRDRLSFDCNSCGWVDGWVGGRKA